MTATQKNLRPSQIIQKKTTTKREEGRSLGLTPYSAETLPPTSVKKILKITQRLLPSKQQAP